MTWRRPLLVLAALFTLLSAGCARDVNMEGDSDSYPLQVSLGFRTADAFDAFTWYFMVFNFTAAPSTSAATAPLDFISDEDRGANWELYVALKKDEGGGTRLVTLQRPRVPTILAVAEGPTDTAVADFDQDGITDIAVACNIGDLVQWIEGAETEVFNTTFFEDAESVHEAEAPFRVHAADMIGNGIADIILLGQGSGDGGAYLRVLENDGSAVFTSLGDNPVDGILVDGIMEDLNDDGFPDAAVVTVDEPGGAGTLRVFIAAEGGVFTQTDTRSVGNDPSSITAGNLDAGGVDLVVGNRGSGADDGSVYFFSGDDSGVFSTAPTILAVAGEVATVSTGRMYGDLDDIVVGYTDSTGQGFLGVFHNDTESALAGPPDTTEVDPNPYYAIVHDVGGDTRLDVVYVNGAPGTEGNTLLIERGDREEVEDSLTTIFKWHEEPINYLVGTEASRIEVSDLDGNGVEDFIMPNSGQTDQGIYTIGLFYGLGKANYTSADIYWTDAEPENLILQDWYISHAIGPNSFELTIDPGLFYDLARQQPEDFIVDFMTGTTGIDIDSNPDQLGEVRDNLLHPFNVPMDIGHYNDEQNLPLANTDIAPVGSEDIVDWRVEVF